MDVGVLKQDGALLLHRNRQAAPEPFLQAVAPYRDGLVVAVACLFPCYGLADLCADAGMPCVLGHARDMKAIHGGQATNAKIDSHKIAALLRGGMLPTAAVYPAQMRATRAWLRRRTPLMRNRAALLSQGQNTHSQYPLPEIGKKSADQAPRAGVAERFADRAGPKTLAVALALLTYYAALLKDLALFLLPTAQHHAPHPLSLLQTVPGLGTMLRLGVLYEILRIDRLPSVHAFASSARLGKGRTASGGTRGGTAGQKIGNAHLTWAFSAAAPLCLRNTPSGQKRVARLEKKHAKGTALSMLAHQLGRAVSCLLQRTVAFDMERFLPTAGSSAGEPGASLDSDGRRLERACSQPSRAASGNAQACRGRFSLSPRD